MQPFLPPTFSGLQAELTGIGSLHKRVSTRASTSLTVLAGPHSFIFLISKLLGDQTPFFPNCLALQISPAAATRSRIPTKQHLRLADNQFQEIMSPKLPARSAGPIEIRAYIARVLMSKHDISSELADETANLWRLGRGSELRDASVRVFEGIFGDFNGWLLYRIVHEDELEDWQQSIIGIISFCKLMY
jgi:hypothetical protein